MGLSLEFVTRYAPVGPVIIYFRAALTVAGVFRGEGGEREEDGEGGFHRS